MSRTYRQTMSEAEFTRLMGYWNARKGQQEHMPLWCHGKRTAKGRAKGVGQFLADTRVIPGVGLETQIRKTWETPERTK